MNITNNCPCCGDSLLRHIRQGGVYSFSQGCWQEVPLLTGSSLSGVVEGKNKTAIAKEFLNS